MKKDLFGAHLSIAGGLETVFKRAAYVGATAVQIFTKSNKSYFAKPLTTDERAAFSSAWKSSEVKVVVTHAAYLINLAASDANVEKKSILSLRAEVQRCEELKIPYLVLHPGSHTGAGVEIGIKRIAHNLSHVLHETPGETMVLLETAAGQGSAVGATFEELRAIYDACDKSIQHRIGVCFDTCHVWASGYNIDSIESYHEIMKKFDAIVGRTLLKVVHLNDSQSPCDARKDRHANLGKGTIPLAVLRVCADDMNERGIAVVLETPSVDGLTEYKEELALLRS